MEPSAIRGWLLLIQFAPWQCLYLRPLPQGQGSLRPTLVLLRLPAVFGAVKEDGSKPVGLAQQQRRPGLLVGRNALVVAHAPFVDDRDGAAFDFARHDARLVVLRESVERVIDVLVVLHDQTDDGLRLLFALEIRRILTVFDIPHPTQHLAGHNHIRAGHHGCQVTIEHGRVHAVGRRRCVDLRA